MYVVVVVYVYECVGLLAFDFVLDFVLWINFCVGCEGSTHPWEGREALG